MENTVLDQQLQQTREQARAETARILQTDSYYANLLAERISALVSGGRSLIEMQQSPMTMDRFMGFAAPMLGAAAMESLGLGNSSAVLATQNMFSQGGMRLAGPAGMIPLTNYGFAADQLTQQYFERMNYELLGPTGAPDLSRTFGASINDVGQTLQELQRRGAFAGVVGGQLETLTPSRLQQLRTDAANAGNQSLMQELSGMEAGMTMITMDPGLPEKAGRIRDDALRALSEVRSVLGNLRPQEIFSELERLTGVDIGRPGGLQSGLQMFRDSMSSGMGAGLTAAQALEFRAATASTLDASMAAMSGAPTGAYYRASSAMAGAVDQVAHAAFLEQQAMGGTRMRGEIGAAAASNVSRVFMEAPELTEALFAASTMQGPGRDQLLESVRAYGAAGTQEARQMARRQMGSVLESAYGVRSGALVNNLGMDNMLDAIAARDPSLLQAGAVAALASDQSAMVGDFRRFLGATTGGAAAFGGLDRGAQILHGLFTGLSADQRASMLSGDYGALRGVQVAGGDAGQMLGDISSRVGQQTLQNMLGMINASVQATPSMASMVSQSGVGTHQHSAASAAADLMQLRGRSGMSFGQKFLHGVMGGTLPEDDQNMLSYAEGMETAGESWISRYRVNSQMGLSVTPEQARSLAMQAASARQGDKSGANLYREFGVDINDPNRDTKLAKAMGGEGAFKRIADMFGNDPSQIAGLRDGQGGTDFTIVQDPGKLRDQFEGELAKIRGTPDKPIDAAARTGSRMQTQQPMSVTFNLVTPGGTQTLQGTVTGLTVPSP